MNACIDASVASAMQAYLLLAGLEHTTAEVVDPASSRTGAASHLPAEPHPLRCQCLCLVSCSAAEGWTAEHTDRLVEPAAVLAPLISLP